MTAASNGRWLGAVGFIVGLTTGGLGSAAIGNYQYNSLLERITVNELRQHLQEVEIKERLTVIETKLDGIYRSMEEIKQDMER